MRLIRALVALPIVLALGACAKGSTGGTKVELWTMALKPTFTSYMQDSLVRFEAQHPGVHVEWVDVPGNAIEDKTLSAVSGGAPPDLVNLNPDFAQRLASKGALQDLGAQIPRALLSSYFPAALAANRHEGKLVGLPWYLSTQVTLFNRSLLQKAGLVRLPDNFRDLAALAPAFKPLGAVPFVPNFGDGNRILELFALDGVPLLSKDRKHAAFDTPAGRDTFDFWAGLFRSGTLSREALNLDHREVVDRFQAGQSAVLASGPQFLRQVKENAPELYQQLEVAPQLSGKSGKVGVGVMNLVIPTASQHSREAIALALFLTSAERQLAFCKLAAILPSVRQAAQAPFFTQLPATASLEDRARRISAEQLPRAVLLVPPMPHHADLKRAMNDALQRAALGEQPPEASLKQAAAEWDRILATP